MTETKQPKSKNENQAKNPTHSSTGESPLQPGPHAQKDWRGGRGVEGRRGPDRGVGVPRWRDALCAADFPASATQPTLWGEHALGHLAGKASFSQPAVGRGLPEAAPPYPGAQAAIPCSKLGAVS